MSYQERDGQVILSMSREDYERLITRLSCGKKFVWGFRVYTCALPKGHEDDCDDHPYRGVLIPNLGQDLLNRLNSGNPNYTPYRTGESKS